MVRSWHLTRRSTPEADVLRIGYLTGEYPRATDTFIEREVAALRARGIEVSHVGCYVEDRHLAAESREGLGELAADGPAADDSEPSR